MASGLTNGTMWLLVSSAVLLGFYIGDTAPSREFIVEDFDGAREEVRTAHDVPTADGAQDGYLPPGAQSTILFGFGLMEPLALWAHATDGTIFGDGIECLAILAILSKPLGSLLEVAR